LKLVTVRGQITVEETDRVLKIDSNYINELARVGMNRSYKQTDGVRNYYHTLERKLKEAKPIDETSRQWVAVFDPKFSCVSMLQILNREDENSLLVAMRSSSARKMRDDLIFFSLLAKYYDCVSVTILIGSFHVEIDPETNDE